jgi:hypothetical protein
MNMFYSPIEAARELKRMSKEMNEHDNLYLCFSEASEKFYVSYDEMEIEDQIRKGFDGGDSAESHARMFQVWKYAQAFKKERYPNTYRHAKKAVIEGLIRVKVDVEPEYSVSFNIS